MEEKKINREFKGIWICKEIWLSKDLNSEEKIFLAEIDSLEKLKGCFASNRYFADFFNKSSRTISSIISKLEIKGYISTSYIFINETKGIKNRVIKINWKKIHAKQV